MVSYAKSTNDQNYNDDTNTIGYNLSESPDGLRPQIFETLANTDKGKDKLFGDFRSDESFGHGGYDDEIFVFEMARRNSMSQKDSLNSDRDGSGKLNVYASFGKYSDSDTETSCSMVGDTDNETETETNTDSSRPPGGYPKATPHNLSPELSSDGIQRQSEDWESFGVCGYTSSEWTSSEESDNEAPNRRYKFSNFLNIHESFIHRYDYTSSDDDKLYGYFEDFDSFSDINDEFLEDFGDDPVDLVSSASGNWDAKSRESSSSYNTIRGRSQPAEQKSGQHTKGSHTSSGSSTKSGSPSSHGSSFTASDHQYDSSPVLGSNAESGLTTPSEYLSIPASPGANRKSRRYSDNSQRRTKRSDSGLVASKSFV